jgi:hypothetical protein
MIAGVACAFTMAAMMTIGIFLLPFVGLGTFLLYRKRAMAGFGWAMLTGVGFIPLLIAFLNREGPGNICHTFRDGGQACTEELSPWPFLAVAFAVVVSGTLLCRRARRGSARS